MEKNVSLATPRITMSEPYDEFFDEEAEGFKFVEETKEDEEVTEYENIEEEPSSHSNLAPKFLSIRT